MANSWFRFKQFTIEQGKSAMKVGTDGVLLGAWADVSTANNILDIGAGTGLIALMLAQRSPLSNITAIEIDHLASEQALENFQNSPWSNRLSLFNQSVQTYAKDTSRSFDLIVSNPPYFENISTSDNTQRQIARHTNTLSFEELLEAVQKLLMADGVFSVILPYSHKPTFVELAKQQSLFLNKVTHVYPTNKSEIKRMLLSFSFKDIEIKQDSLVIEPEQRHQYSKEYIQMTKDFYLNF